MFHFLPSLSRHSREGGNPSPDAAVENKVAAATVDLPKNESGFTLIELLVVIVIIGLLATIVAINVIPATGKARTEKARADIAMLEQAMEQYRLDNFNYPAGSDGLAALRAAPPSLQDPSRYRQGGYIKKLPNDPWGKPYVYVSKPGGFDIYTLGADGQPGGDSENADVHSGA